MIEVFDGKYRKIVVKRCNLQQRKVNSLSWNVTALKPVSHGMFQQCISWKVIYFTLFYMHIHTQHIHQHNNHAVIISNFLIETHKIINNKKLYLTTQKQPVEPYTPWQQYSYLYSKSAQDIIHFDVTILLAHETNSYSLTVKSHIH